MKGAAASRLVAAGLFAVRLGDQVGGHERHAAGVALCRGAGDLWTVAWGLGQIGWVLLLRGDVIPARDRFAESVSQFREIGQPWGTPIVLASLGLALALTDDTGTFQVLDESIALARAQGDSWSLARCYEHIGDAARVAGDTQRARVAFEECLRYFRELGYVNAGAVARYDLGSLALLERNVPGAASHFSEALEIHLEHGDQQGLAKVLMGFARMAARLGRPEAAARLLGAATARFDAINLALWLVDQAEVDRVTRDLRRTLGDAAYAAAREQGRALSTEAATAAARTIAEEAMTVKVAPGEDTLGSQFGLTPREVEVAHLLARRLTDREIADALFISPKTAGNHVGSILAKLGVADRREAAALVMRLGVATTS